MLFQVDTRQTLGPSFSGMSSQDHLYASLEDTSKNTKAHSFMFDYESETSD